jgi:hypothetical protein
VSPVSRLGSSMTMSCVHVIIVPSSLADLVQRVAVWSLLGSLNTVCTSAWLHPFACLLDVCMTAVSQGCCCRTTEEEEEELRWGTPRGI